MPICLFVSIGYVIYIAVYSEVYFCSNIVVYSVVYLLLLLTLLLLIMMLLSMQLTLFKLIIVVIDQCCCCCKWWCYCRCQTGEKGGGEQGEQNTRVPDRLGGLKS